MPKIEKIEKTTDQRFLNMYTFKVENRVGRKSSYFVASRAESVEDLRVNNKEKNPDGVIIYSLYGENRDKIVLIRQYRYSIGDYIYEFPAGLVEKDENFEEAAIRELKEETGLTLEAIKVDSIYSKPYFTTIGMTDECCGMIYGYATGTPSNAGQEDSEEIEIVLADKEEVRRILKEENVSLMCAYMMMHFLNTEEGKTFDFLNLQN